MERRIVFVLFLIFASVQLQKLIENNECQKGDDNMDQRMIFFRNIVIKSIQEVDSLREELSSLRNTVKNQSENIQKMEDKLFELENASKNRTVYYEAGEWQQWSDYSRCSRTCVPADGRTGIQTRSRSCVFTLSPAIHSNISCKEGERGSQTRSCAADKPCSAFVRTNTLDNVGGSGGNPFSDVAVWNDKNITALRMNCKQEVLSIQVKYGNTWGNKHGKYSTKKCENGTDYEYTLDNTEYINKVQYRYGRLVNAMTITTNKRTLPTCGRLTGSRKTVSGKRLLYISGRSGCVIDALQVHWAI